MKVNNLNGYANQFVLIGENKTTFQSYNSLVAHLMKDNHLFLDGDTWDYSTTTRRHFKAFINEYTPYTYEDKAQWLKEIETNDNIEVL